MVLGCALAAIARGVILPEVLANTSGSAADILTALVYPLGDMLLLGIAVWAVALAGYRLSWVPRLLIPAFLLLASVDVVYVYRIAEGSWSVGTAARISYPAAMTLIGIAAWQRPRPRRPIDPTSVRLLAVPTVAGVIGAALVVADRWLELPASAYLLAVSAVVLAVTRVLIYQYGIRELRASLRFERGFDETSVGMALASVGGEWLRVNAALAALLDRAPAHLIGIQSPS